MVQVPESPKKVGGNTNNNSIDKIASLERTKSLKAPENSTSKGPS